MNSSLFSSLICLLAGLVLVACEPTPEEARQHIIDEGYSYDADGLLKALKEDDMPIKLRFLIADPDLSIRNGAFLWLASCEEAHTPDYLDCIKEMQWLVDRGTDVHFEDKLQQNALTYAAQTGQLEIIQWLINEGVEVKSQQLVQRVIAEMNRQMFVPERRRMEKVARALQIQWMIQSGEEVQTSVGKGLLGNNPFVKPAE